MAMTMLGEALVPVHRLSVEDFHQMVELGILDEEDRVELLDGALVDMSPNSPAHAEAIVRATRLLAGVFGQGLDVRVQLPLTLDTSEPEPDLAVVVPGKAGRHPSTAVMVVEVAVTSQAVDRGIKALLYAAAGIPEYWLLDVPAGTLEVRREPVDGVYNSTQVFGGKDTVEPLHVPVGAVKVSELLGS